MSSVPTLGDRRLSLAAILASAFGVGLTVSMATPLVSLMLADRGHGSLTIGLVAAAYSVAILAVGPVVPAIVHRAGPIRILLAGLLLSAAALAVLPFAGALALVVLLRFVTGAGTALDWIVSETWINTLPSAATRGRVVGLYATVWGAGIAGGPILLSLVGTAGAAPFWLAAAILLLAGAPVLAARRLAPTLADGAPVGAVRAAVRAAPLALGTGFLCGFGEGAVFALFPVYGLALGLDTARAVLLVSVFAAGSLALQLPIGWLADRMPRWTLVRATAGVSIACAGLVPVAFGVPGAIGPVLFVWGGAVAGFYTLGLILLGARFGSGGLAGANTAFVMAYTVGAMVGPAAGGAAMALWPPHGLLVLLALAGAAYLAATVGRAEPRAVEAE